MSPKITDRRDHLSKDAQHFCTLSVRQCMFFTPIISDILSGNFMKE